MKKTHIAFAVSLVMFGSVAVAQTRQSQQATSTNDVSSSSAAQATNAGNAQTINFNSPASSTSTVNQEVNQQVNQTGDVTNRVISSGGTRDRVEYGGSYSVKNVPNVSGPPLVSSNDTCMGSTSGSANAVGWGLSFGSTWTDRNCVMLKNSREMWNMGQPGAALARMCQDADNRMAFEQAGFECPQTDRAERMSIRSQVDQNAGMAPAQQQAVAEQPNLLMSTRVSTSKNSGVVYERSADQSFANANLNDPYVRRRAGLD